MQKENRKLGRNILKLKQENLKKKLSQGLTGLGKTTKKKEEQWGKNKPEKETGKQRGKQLELHRNQLKQKSIGEKARLARILHEKDWASMEEIKNTDARR